MWLAPPQPPRSVSWHHLPPRYLGIRICPSHLAWPVYPPLPVADADRSALTTFQNLIYKGFGFTSLETVLYSLPMYATTFVTVVLFSVIVRYFPRSRFPLAIFVQFICVFVLLFAGLANVGKWAKWGVWMFSLVYSTGTFILAWPMISVNVAGRTKKSFFGATSL